MNCWRIWVCMISCVCAMFHEQVSNVSGPACGTNSMYYNSLALVATQGGTTSLRALRNCWLCTFILNGNVCVLLRPGLAALNNLADNFFAGWLLPPSKVLDLRLPYPTPTPFSFCNTKSWRYTIGWQEYCYKKTLPWPRQHSYHSWYHSIINVVKYYPRL